MATVSTQTHAPAARRPLRIYLPIALFAIVVAFVGFWSSYYGRIFTGTVTTAAIIRAPTDRRDGHLELIRRLGHALLCVTPGAVAPDQPRPGRAQQDLRIQFVKAEHLVVGRTEALLR